MHPVSSSSLKRHLQTSCFGDSEQRPLEVGSSGEKLLYLLRIRVVTLANGYDRLKEKNVGWQNRKYDHR